MFCFLLNNHCYCYCVLVTSVKICEWDQVETELKNVPINILKSQDKYMFLNTIKHLVSLLYEKWIFYSQHTVCWTFLASESGMFLVILAQFDYAHSKIFNCDNLSGLDHEFSHPLKSLVSGEFKITSMTACYSRLLSICDISCLLEKKMHKMHKWLSK